MKRIHEPVRVTIAYGALCGIVHIPLSLAANLFFSPAVALRLVLWVYLAGYGLLLSGQGGRRPAGIAFPLLLLLVTALWALPMTAYLPACLGTLSWIRCGVPLRGSRLGRTTIELLLCFLGGATVAVLAPPVLLSRAVAVWLFFLLQALYFVLFEAADRSDVTGGIDPFVAARRAAERIVADR
jgi:hypothetical protein